MDKKIYDLFNQICPDFAPYRFLPTDLYKGKIIGGHNLYYKKGKDNTEGVICCKRDIQKFGLNQFPTNFVTFNKYDQSDAQEGWSGENLIAVVRHIQDQIAVASSDTQKSNIAQWIIPCNIELYDIFGAFKKLKCIDWKQSNHSIVENDEVYIYVGKPIAAIMYKCKVNKANLEEADIDDAEFVINGEEYENYGNYMELELLEEYEQSRFSIEALKANGLHGGIQGPRHVNELAEFLNSNDGNWAEKIENEILESELQGEEKEIITKVRINQSIYREKLLHRYNSCCLCGVSDARMLLASHIKPWSQCTPKEKVDVDNGFLLCPNHDKVFDSGLITFDDDGNIIISKGLKETDRIFLNVRETMKIEISEKNKAYIEYHRNHIFKE